MKIDAEDRVRKEEKLEIARGMVVDNIPTDTIQKYTGLSFSEIEGLKQPKS
jgi:hypothetical protein